MSGPRVQRCLIYTRKSTEEGLEQEFNSLDAQREACEAYIRSQAVEGWIAGGTVYSDPGLSGGTLQRPGLQQMLSEIRTGRVDVVVVYKVDRLTRSLADFARLLELFEDQGVSFVSVTQQFNTTTSMGRLTLNMLLSFAQFEREITSERIRDKFAASRRKGLWMGGVVPLGYDLEDRKLVVNETEARQVRAIFRLYAELRSVSLLKQELDRRGWVSKRRTALTTGRRIGGVPFSRGALYSLLSNEVYLGRAVYRGESFPGQHRAIVPDDLFGQVRQILSRNRERQTNLEKQPNLLAGRVFDERGRRFTASHTNRRGSRYRYYAIAAGDRRDGETLRVPAFDLETAVLNRLLALLQDAPALIGAAGAGEDIEEQVQLLTAAAALEKDLFRMEPGPLHGLTDRLVRRVEIRKASLKVELSRHGLRQQLLGGKDPDLQQDTPVPLLAERVVTRQGPRIRMVLEPGPANSPSPGHNPALVKAIARGYVWSRQIIGGEVGSIREIARMTGETERYVGHTVRLGLLAPDIVVAILAGKEPAGLSLGRLMRTIPLSWAEQRELWGFDD